MNANIKNAKDKSLIIESASKSLLDAINTRSKYFVRTVLKKVLENDKPTKDLLSLSEMIEGVDLQGLLGGLYKAGALSLGKEIRLNPPSISAVVVADVLIYATIRESQNLEWAPTVSRHKNPNSKGLLQDSLDIKYGGGMVRMASFLINQNEHSPFERNQVVDVSAHYKPEVLSLISDFLLKNAVNHDLGELNTDEVSSIKRKRI